METSEVDSVPVLVSNVRHNLLAHVFLVFWACINELDKCEFVIIDREN